MSILDEIVEKKKATEEIEVSESSNEEENQNNEQKEDESFSEMLDEHFVDTDKIVEGDVVEGKVIAINDNYIFVSLGGKHEAYADVDDYRGRARKLKIKIGDTLRGFVVKKSDSEIVISRSLNRKYVDKGFLNNAYTQKIPVQGKVVGSIKGGLTVEMLGTRAFCPFAQVDIGFVANPSSMIGKYYDFIITEMTDGMKNIIVSRKALLQEEVDKLKSETLSKLKVGDIVVGKVSRIANFGAFVDLGGIDGLLHVSQLSWCKVDSPHDVIKVGEDIKVKVTGISGEKISLSVKEMQENPLDKALETLQEGDVVDCRILRNESFGSFCEIKPGVEGLIPISEMLHNGRIGNPSELFTVGDLVSAQIIRIMKDEKKISLSVKALKPDPWDHIEEYLKEGQEVEGIVDGITNFGVFVRLTEGLIGLLPKSKLFRTKAKFTENEINSSVNVRINQIDKEKKRISLELAEAEQTQQTSDSFRPLRGFPGKGDSDKKQKPDWRKFATTKQEVPEDNPFSDL